MKKINYINLTNGIEVIPMLDYLNEDYRFIRIQSSILERKQWDKFIQDLDYDFLMNLALGNFCYVYDYGANKPIPRSVYQGLEFLKYVLYKRWYGVEYCVNIVKSKKSSHKYNCNKYFNECYINLCERSKKKIDYFKPYLSGKINLVSITDSTIHDRNKEFYRNILLKKIS